MSLSSACADIEETRQQPKRTQIGGVGYEQLVLQEESQH